MCRAIDGCNVYTLIVSWCMDFRKAEGRADMETLSQQDGGVYCLFGLLATATQIGKSQ
jgi:hypothetical protein